MKRPAAIIAVLCLWVRLANAGPEPMHDDKKAVVMPPPAPEMCNWTGFYIGGNIGGAFDTADLSLNLTGFWDNLPATQAVGEQFGSRNLDASGLLAGGFVGYNFQWNHWVLGLEGTIDYLGLRNSSDTDLVFVAGDGGNVIGTRESFKTHYLGTVAPRIGYSWNRLLIFATGGVAFGDVDFWQQVRELDSGLLQEHSTDDTRIGWTVGGGLEYCLTNHWSVRVDYRYTELDCADFSTAARAKPLFPPRDVSGFTGHHEACLDFHSVAAGFAYRF